MQAALLRTQGRRTASSRGRVHALVAAAAPPPAQPAPLLTLRLSALPLPVAPARSDYNQKHFVRNEGFSEAADDIQGATRKIFIEFLERSCTAGGAAAPAQPPPAQA